MIAILLSLASPDPAAALVARASARLSVVPAETRDRSAQWRVDPEEERRPTMKDRAVAENGAPCTVVGSRLCTRKPRTLLRTDLPR